MITATPTAIRPRRTAKMTVDEYLALDESERFRELVDGILVHPPTPDLEHQHILMSLYGAIETYLVSVNPRPGIAFYRVAVAFSPIRLAVPDLVYVRMERQHLLRHPILYDAPDLVTEVLSRDRPHDRDKDLIRNRQWYAAAGIPEYWIMDPVHDTLTVLELAAGQYRERAVLTARDTLTTPTIPGLSIPLTEIFDDPVRAMLRQP